MWLPFKNTSPNQTNGIKAHSKQVSIGKLSLIHDPTVTEVQFFALEQRFFLANDKRRIV